MLAIRDIRDRHPAFSDPAYRPRAENAVLVSSPRRCRGDPRHLLGFPVIDSSQPVPRQQKRGQVI
jgi:hypothetical protein